jgi:hypothetical protein
MHSVFKSHFQEKDNLAFLQPSPLRDYALGSKQVSKKSANSQSGSNWEVITIIFDQTKAADSFLHYSLSLCLCREE